MLVVTPEKVLRDISSICQLSRFNEHIRSHIVDEADLSEAATRLGAEQYIAARKNTAEPLAWKVFSHCASVTRLYALYEGYVYELLSDLVNAFPDIYQKAGDLPEPVLKNYRTGIGSLLQKYGDGYVNAELNELQLATSLQKVLSG